MSARLWLPHSIEGLFRALAGRITPPLAEQLAAVGVTPHSGPVDTQSMCAAVRLISGALYGSLAPAVAERELGRVFVRGYGRTLVGAALLQFMRMIGPKASLERMQRNLRTGTNFVETRFTSVAPGVAELWFNDDGGIPEFFAGIVEEGAKYTGAKQATVEVVARDESGAFTIRVAWT